MIAMSRAFFNRHRRILCRHFSLNASGLSGADQLLHSKRSLSLRPYASTRAMLSWRMCRRQVLRNALRCASSGVFTRLLPTTTPSNVRPRSSVSMLLTTVSALEIASSISADESMAVTRKPAQMSGCVMRPAPAPSSRIVAPAGSADLIMIGSSPALSRRYSSTAHPSCVIVPGPVASFIISRDSVSCSTRSTSLYINC